MGVEWVVVLKYVFCFLSWVLVIVFVFFVVVVLINLEDIENVKRVYVEVVRLDK